MRWDFLLPPRSEDVELGALRHEAIERWWRTFAASAPRLEGALHGDTPELPALDAGLAAVHPELSWEVGTTPHAARALTITPADRKELRPLVSALLARAPRLNGWEFYPYRLPAPQALSPLLETRLGRAAPDLRVALTRGEGNRIDLHYTSALLDSPAELLAAAQLASEALLGQELLELWAGVIEVEEDPAGAIPVAELPAAFALEREQIRASLPDVPHWELVAETPWTSYKLEPTRAASYPRRRGVIAGITQDYNLVRTLQAELPFSSFRFSRQGEVFAYLKLARGAVPDRELVEWREALAVTLTGRLGPYGACVGGASGFGYCYLDLALCDVAAAIPLIRAAAQEGEAPVPRASWLLFCDDVWRGEWVGLWDDTPPPPASEES